MALLDLAPSREKLARAREHLDTLKVELSATLAERHPYTIRVSEINPDNGQCSAFLVPRDFEKELRLGVLVGDVIHNLRSGLDLIVSQLVVVSEVRPTTRHQFPIFRTKEGYLRRVGDRNVAKSDGPLHGIRYGLADIWDVQPFNCTGDARLTPLFLINEFSNGDKHRILAGYMPLIKGGLINLSLGGGQLIKYDRFRLADAIWEAGKEYEIARMRFAPPYPLKVEPTVDFDVEVNFATTPVDDTNVGKVIGITESDLEEMCERVLQLTTMFANR